MRPDTYQIEIANRLRGGRAVGTEYVVTRRPVTDSRILARFDTRDEASVYLATLERAR